MGDNYFGEPPDCNDTFNNSGCPIYEAKNAAVNFTNTLLPSNDTAVGVVGFRGCYNTPNTYSGCVTTGSIGALSNSAATVLSKINALTAETLVWTEPYVSGTNICGGFDKAASVLLPPASGAHTASNTVRIVVLLSDGDSNPNPNARTSSSPVTACKPPGDMSPHDDGSCQSSTQSNEANLDSKTKARVDSLKAQGVEVYVVGFGVCGTNNAATTCNTSSVGQTGSSYPDNTANRNLLKCIASSAAGTNDHYFEATSATQLPSIFTQIAQAIAFRLVK
jgi:hypothetical protein